MQKETLRPEKVTCLSTSNRINASSGILFLFFNFSVLRNIWMLLCVHSPPLHFSHMKCIGRRRGRSVMSTFENATFPKVEMLLICDFTRKKTAFDAICSPRPNPNCNSNWNGVCCSSTGSNTKLPLAACSQERSS